MISVSFQELQFVCNKIFYMVLCFLVSVGTMVAGRVDCFGCVCAVQILR